MKTTVEAEQNLQIIRSLLERNTVHRALSSATALVGGVLSAVIAAWEIFHGGTSGFQLLVHWGVVLLVTGAANTAFLCLSARKRGGPFLSRGFRMTVFSAAPPLLAGAVIAGAFWWFDPTLSSILCATFYGLALLSTQTFAPRSVVVLGTTFLGFSLVTLVSGFWIQSGPYREWFTAPVIMGLSFGGFHLAYAAVTWPRSGGFFAALNDRPEAA
jgi:hypothetical protein